MINKFVAIIVIILLTVALVGSGVLPIWGDVLLIIACVGALYGAIK